VQGAGVDVSKAGIVVLALRSWLARLVRQAVKGHSWGHRGNCRPSQFVPAASCAPRINEAKSNGTSTRFPWIVYEACSPWSTLYFPPTYVMWPLLSYSEVANTIHKALAAGGQSSTSTLIRWKRHPVSNRLQRPLRGTGADNRGPSTISARLE
jgi:hypothetical protein